MNFLVIVLLFVVFLQTRIMDLRRAIICLSVQSAVIALACFISGIAHGEGIHIYAPGLLTIIVKVLLVPYAMLRLVSKLTDERELISEINVNYSTAASAVFLVLSYLIVDKMLPGVEGRDILALSIVMILTGLTLIVMRSRSYYADGRLDNNGKWYLPFRDGDDGRSASGYRNGYLFGRADCCHGTGNTD